MVMGLKEISEVCGPALWVARPRPLGGQAPPSGLSVLLIGSMGYFSESMVL